MGLRDIQQSPINTSLMSLRDYGDGGERRSRKVFTFSSNFKRELGGSREKDSKRGIYNFVFLVLIIIIVFN